MSRLILVSNRLPVTIKAGRRGVTTAPSTGGLATGLWGPHQSGEGLWFGWPGETSSLSPAQQQEVERRLTQMRAMSVPLSDEEHKRYYQGFSNGVLWPLCHYLIDRVTIDSQDFGVYREVNQRFADRVAAAHQPGDLIWIQDYHLLLLPQMLRARLPGAKIGFFLHIPFPSSEVFRILPWRSVILEGLLGADLIGFHTHAYMRHFSGALLRILGIEARVDQLTYRGREIRLGAFPMGIDADGFSSLADSPSVAAAAEKIRAEASPRRLFVAIDRLDFTKGIPRRMQAFERFLEQNPALRDEVRFVQVAVPSRSGIGQYQRLRRQVEELLGRINGRFGTVSAVPIHSIYRSMDRTDVVALYRAADVMVVTPLRDGLNLVAKEFCASRTDNDGSLILSEFAGSAAELGEALRVNPYDIDQVAGTFRQALDMSPHERQTRMRALRQRVSDYNVHRWVDSFVEALKETCEGRECSAIQASAASIDELARTISAATELDLLLDYDGTLKPFAIFPGLASPDDELLDLLTALSRRAGTRVHILSGRLRQDLEEWFGDLPVGLYAEHGLWLRPLGQEWTPLTELDTDWKKQVMEIMQHHVNRTPGTFIEEKTASAAWHWRNADLEFGALQAKELRLHLMGSLSNLPVEVLQGEKVIEVRMHGVNKGAAVRRILGDSPRGAVLAMGDDRTDEDMYAALPAGGYSVHVGMKPSTARYSLPDSSAAREFLSRLLPQETQVHAASRR
ncbi:MAG: bifunctional alpha,alpha-trehalose-phosphate synthase (UDP-forming)/trehalose-phosphatase [Phycisphaerae bacterium]